MPPKPETSKKRLLHDKTYLCIGLVFLDKENHGNSFLHVTDLIGSGLRTVQYQVMNDPLYHYLTVADFIEAHRRGSIEVIDFDHNLILFEDYVIQTNWLIDDFEYFRRMCIKEITPDYVSLAHGGIVTSIAKQLFLKNLRKGVYQIAQPEQPAPSSLYLPMFPYVGLRFYQTNQKSDFTVDSLSSRDLNANIMSTSELNKVTRVESLAVWQDRVRRGLYITMQAASKLPVEDAEAHAGLRRVILPRPKGNTFYADKLEKDQVMLVQNSSRKMVGVIHYDGVAYVWRQQGAKVAGAITTTIMQMVAKVEESGFIVVMV